jgi:hypothetical protein
LVDDSVKITAPNIIIMEAVEIVDKVDAGFIEKKVAPRHKNIYTQTNALGRNSS